MKNVLIVDDDDISIFILKKLLKEILPPAIIQTARNGKEALSILANHLRDTSTPFTIFLDLNMPVMDGFGFIKEFNLKKLSERENVNIVVVSSSSHPHDILKVRELGIQHYLTKPVAAEHLKSIV